MPPLSSNSSSPAQPASEPPSAALASAVLVYDPSVEQVNTLLAGLDSGVAAWPVLPGNNPLEHIARALAFKHLKTLHILGHGAPGEVILGGQRLGASSFESLADALPSAGPAAFQIAFWSCKTGHGELGMNFVNTIANAINHKRVNDH